MKSKKIKALVEGMERVIERQDKIIDMLERREREFTNPMSDRDLSLKLSRVWARRNRLDAMLDETNAYWEELWAIDEYRRNLKKQELEE